MDPSRRADLHRSLALQVARAHAALGDAALLAFVSGSTVEGLVDERSDIDMSVVLTQLPARDALQACCRTAGGGDWTWSAGDAAQGSLVVSFPLEGVEVQIGYATHMAFTDTLDELLVRHNPDTPNHKLAEGVMKAEPLVDEAALRAWQQRLSEFPQALREAMARHAVATPTHWRAAAQIIRRDTTLWCRDIQVDACYRLLLALCGINRRYFTRFQVKRVHKLAAGLAIAPAALADRIDAVMNTPAEQAFGLLHALEADVLDLVGQHLPAIDTAAARQRLGLFAPARTPG